MSVETLKEMMGDTAKDIRINLSKVLSEEGAPGLNQKQIMGTALACAYATRQPHVIAAVEAKTEAMVLSAEEIAAAKAAASIMAMNNVYYRFIHLAADDEIKKMPANLRMQVIANPGVPRSILNYVPRGVGHQRLRHVHGIHAHEIAKQGLSKLGIQSAVRIAAVVSSAAQALTIASSETA